MLTALTNFYANNQGAIWRFLFVLIVGQIVIKLVMRLVNRTKVNDKFDRTVSLFMSNLVKFMLYAIYLIVLLSIVGVPMTTFVAMLSAIGLAIALALQGNLANFASAIVILVFKPFEVGDFIETKEHMGSVQQIQLLFTHLLTPDNRRVVVPNAQLVSSSVVNFSYETTRRVQLVYNAAYEHDVDLVLSILRAIVDSNDKILAEPEPTIRLKNHGESALEYDVMVWVNSEHYWDVRYWLNEEVRRTFVTKGIKMPYPQRQVTMING